MPSTHLWTVPSGEPFGWFELFDNLLQNEKIQQAEAWARIQLGACGITEQGILISVLKGKYDLLPIPDGRFFDNLTYVLAVFKLGFDAGTYKQTMTGLVAGVKPSDVINSIFNIGLRSDNPVRIGALNVIESDRFTTPATRGTRGGAYGTLDANPAIGLSYYSAHNRDHLALYFFHEMSHVCIPTTNELIAGPMGKAIRDWWKKYKY
jgi:hypothetical protein